MIFYYFGYFPMVLVYLWNKGEINGIFFSLNIWALYCSQKYCLIFVARDICFGTRATMVYAAWRCVRAEARLSHTRVPSDVFLGEQSYVSYRT